MRKRAKRQNPQMASQIFISYAREDRPRVAELAARLEEGGYTVWWDRGIVPGHQFDQVIEREVDSAGCVVVCWSAAAVASEWVKNEAAAGAERGVMIPVQLETVRLPLEFRRRQTVDLSEWHGKVEDPAFQQLLFGVRSVLMAPQGTSVARVAPSNVPRPPRRPLIMAGLAAVGVAGIGAAWWRPWLARNAPVAAIDASAPAKAAASSPGPSTPPAFTDGYPIVARLYSDKLIMARAVFTRRGYLLTVSHVLDRRGPVRARWEEDGVDHEAAVELATDIQATVSLLRLVGQPLRARPMTIRIAGSLQLGDSVARFISANDRAPGVVKEIHATRQVSDGRHTEALHLLVTSAITAPGDSGAPVVDSRGAVVGLVYGGSLTESIMIAIETITVRFPQAF